MLSTDLERARQQVALLEATTRRSEELIKAQTETIANITREKENYDVLITVTVRQLMLLSRYLPMCDDTRMALRDLIARIRYR